MYYIAEQMSIPQIDIGFGDSITVLIVECCGKYNFVAQPYTLHLIELMEAIR